MMSSMEIAKVLAKEKQARGVRPRVLAEVDGL